MLPFTMDETWTSRYGEDACVHLEQFPEVPSDWRDDALAAKWAKIKTVRRVVTGALEVERREKRIGPSGRSPMTLTGEPAPAGAFTLDDTKGVAVVPALAEGTKCARSWKILPEVGSDPDYPDVTLRDAAALREWDAAHAAA
jgi:isoleucyl-tRNA synthetase